MKKIIKIEFVAKLPFQLKKEDDYYIACCSILNVLSQGTSKKEAQENLIEAISLFFISCYERGTLDAALKECGFEAEKPGEEYASFPTNYLKVPIPFAVPENNTVGCQA